MKRLALLSSLRVRLILLVLLAVIPSLALTLYTGLEERQTSDAAAPTRFESLTARERQVLQLIAEGRTNKEIANLLQVSVKTVEKHRTDLMSKLDVHDIAGLTRLAIKHGLVSLDA